VITQKSPSSGLIWDGVSMSLAGAGGNDTLTLSYAVGPPGVFALVPSNGAGARTVLQLGSGDTDVVLSSRFLELLTTGPGLGSPGGADFNYQPVDEDGVPTGPKRRCIRVGLLGGDGPGGAERAGVELGEAPGEGQQPVNVYSRGEWRLGVQFAGDDSHTVEVLEAWTGAGKDLFLLAGPAADGSGLAGGSLYLQAGAGDGAGVAGEVGVGVANTSSVRVGGDATVNLAGPTTCADLTLPASGTLTISGAHNGIAGSLIASTSATRSIGTSSLPWLVNHLYSTGLTSGLQVHADTTNTERVALQYGSSGVGTGWHLKSPSGSTFVVSTAAYAGLAGQSGAWLYPLVSGGFVALKDTAGNDVVRAAGTGALTFAPSNRPSTYTLNGGSSSRSLSGNAEAVLRQLIADLAAYGILAASA